MILKGIVIFAVGLQILPLIIVGERKLLGAAEPLRPQPGRAVRLRPAPRRDRQGRHEVGLPPAHRDRLAVLRGADPLHRHAVATLAVIPFGNVVDIFGTPVGLYGIDVSVGPMVIFAFGAIAFYGIMLGGWSSGSKYSFLGAMRAARSSSPTRWPRAWRWSAS
jgi:NADH-quinone oxidoreductase subunit H